MSVLTLTKPFPTEDPFVLVENQLKVGTHAFRLVVVDDNDLASDPMDAIVQIVEAVPVPLPVTPVIPVRPEPPVPPVTPIVPVIPAGGGPIP